MMKSTQAEPAVVTHKVMLITINKLFRDDMSDHELSEATKGVWRVGVRREGAEYAFSVYKGIVREVYKIKRWLPAGTLEYRYRDRDELRIPKRWEFEGSVAEDIREQYVGKCVREYIGNGHQNPIKYVNI